MTNLVSFPHLCIVPFFHTDVHKGKLIGVFSNPIKAMEVQESLLSSYNIPKGDDYDMNVCVPIYTFDANSYNIVTYYKKEVSENFHTTDFSHEEITKIEQPSLYVILVHKMFVVKSEIVGIFTDAKKALEVRKSLMLNFNLECAKNLFVYNDEVGVELCIISNTDINKVLNYQDVIKSNPHTSDFIKLSIPPEESSGLWTSHMGALIYKYLHK